MAHKARTAQNRVAPVLNRMFSQRGLNGDTANASRKTRNTAPVM
ncbi:hypothetical protein ACTRW9_03330 [Nitrospina sp. 32_T5]